MARKSSVTEPQMTVQTIAHTVPSFNTASLPSTCNEPYLGHPTDETKGVFNASRTF